MKKITNTNVHICGIWDSVVDALSFLRFYRNRIGILSAVSVFRGDIATHLTSILGVYFETWIGLRNKFLSSSVGRIILFWKRRGNFFESSWLFFIWSEKYQLFSGPKPENKFFFTLKLPDYKWTSKTIIWQIKHFGNISMCVGGGEGA